MVLRSDAVQRASGKGDKIGWDCQALFDVCIGTGVGVGVGAGAGAGGRLVVRTKQVLAGA